MHNSLMFDVVYYVLIFALSCIPVNVYFWL